MKNTKVCKKCGEEKPISEFHKAKEGKFGVRTICKECYKSPRIKEKEIRLSMIPKGFKICTKCGKEKPIFQFYPNNKSKNILRPDCKDCLKIIQKSYYLKNKDKIRKYQIRNIKRIRFLSKIYRLKNLSKIQKNQKLYNRLNKDRINEVRRNHRRKNKNRFSLQLKIRRKTDINFKIKLNIRNRVRKALLGINKSKRTFELLGCDITFLKNHIESQFTEGMSWDNYGNGFGNKGMQEWHIDHIYPCASFDLKKKSEQKICFHWSNLQPLWAINNLRKNANY